MLQVFYILLGFAFTVVVAWSMGRLLFRELGLVFKKLEREALAFLVGAGLLHLVAFLLCATGTARKSIIWIIGTSLIALAGWRGALKQPAEAFPALPRLWTGLLALTGAVFGWLYWMNAMAPEFSPDGTAYHLGLVARYLRAHGFERIPTNIYANLSQAMEMLFLWAFAIGRHSAAAMVHFAFLLVLPLLILSYGRRVGRPVAGAAAALMVFVSPVVGVDGTVAYNDVALAAVIFGLFYLLQIWDEERNPRLLIPVGLLAGMAFAIKYTAFLAVPYALGFVLWRMGWRRAWRGMAVVALMAALLILPWMVKNVITVGNPVSPFANEIFRNPNVHVWFEHDYAKQLRQYGLEDRSVIPMQVTVKGDRLTGLVGPLFLLAPIGLIALRRREGRRVLFAGLLFGLTYAGNIGTRFLVPALPFFATAMALAVEPFEWLLALLVTTHVVISWPSMVSRYCGTTAWRLTEIPVAAAFRHTPEETFLIRKLPEYLIARMIEKHTPPGATVFAFGQVAEAYTTRNILVNFQGALNERMMRTLWTPIVDDFQPHHQRVLAYPAGPYRKLRVIQTIGKETDIWSITEFRVFHQGVELDRSRWQATARPFPWEASLALDGDPMTHWRAWESIQPGQFFEVDLGTATPSDEVRLLAPGDHWRVELRLEGVDAAGRTVRLAEKARLEFPKAPEGLRRLATRELKAHGIGYILVHEGSFGQEDFRKRADDWDLDFLETMSGADLYRIR